MCMWIQELHPRKLTWNLKIPLGKGETSTNHQFLGSMLVFGGVALLYRQDCYVDGNDWSAGNDAYRDDHPVMQVRVLMDEYSDWS